MNRRRWVAVGGVAAVLALAAIVPQAIAETASERGGALAAAPGLPRPAVSLLAAQQRSLAHVTLITGDRVAVDSAGRVVEVVMGPGRAGVRWARQVVNGRTLVIPTDAVRLINRGRLDRRLFDVTRLVADGYDDAHRAQVPLIVKYAGGGQRANAARALARADAEVHRDVPVLGGQALVAARQDTADVWRALTDPDSAEAGSVTTAPGVDQVWLDGTVHASAAPVAADGAGTGTAQIGAPDAWQAGFDGTGITVAVLDSGIDATHPDLKGKVVAAKDFSDSGSTDDRFGHGTHVASTIAGTGAASGGKYRGVAPGARLLAGKVLGDTGSGSESDIIAGMQWAADSGAKVVNMSLGISDAIGQGPAEKAVDRLSAAKGVLFALAAGNDGPRDTTVDSPGSAAAAITVAAVDHDDKLAPFSSRGPTVDDVNLKPDISSPGVDIVAARAAHSPVGGNGPKGYVTRSGTSMATPHVAGAAVILAQQHPDWAGSRIKAMLMGSARPDPKLTAYEQGAGRVDLSQAIKATVLAEPASLGFGTQAWPHTDDRPVAKTLTYRNTGTTPVTLSLTAGETPRVFSVSPETLTIPAGETATATVTADTTRTSADGVHSGMVTATAADGVAVHTPGLIVREAESYNLTLKSLGPDGKVPAVANANVYSLDSGRLYSPYERDTDGDYRVTIRLPKGRYVLDDVVESDRGQSVLVAPNLVMSRDTTLLLDHRTARPIKITAPDRGAAGAAEVIQWAAQGVARDSQYAMGLPAVDTTVGQVGPGAAAKDFVGQVAGAWAGRGASAPQYHIVVNRPGAFFTGLTHRVTLSTMARVDLAIGTSVAKSVTQPHGSWSTPGFPQLMGLNSGTMGRVVSLPLKRTAVYLTATAGLRWSLGFNLSAGSERHVFLGIGDLSFHRYEPGRTYGITYGNGVLGPIVGTGDVEVGGWRHADLYSLCLPMLSDGHLTLDDTATKKTTLTAGGRTYLKTSEDTCATDIGSGLPKAKTHYTLTSTWTRNLRTYQVSNRVTATWTFASAYYDGEGWQRLPLSAVRFHPRLSLTNTTKAGRAETVPVIIQGAAATRGVQALSARVSYDGGRTWKPVAVRSANGKRSITLTYPKKPGTVSFRATLTDRDGNGYTATISNAYRTVR